jgi:hypothetical protein
MVEIFWLAAMMHQGANRGKVGYLLSRDALNVPLPEERAFEARRMS